MSRENFSFDTNIIVGQFIQNIQEYGSEVGNTVNVHRLILADTRLIDFAGFANWKSNKSSIGGHSDAQFWHCRFDVFQ